jgi:ERCC4-type nuclease
MVSEDGGKSPLSPKQTDYLLSTMRIVIDTREQVNHWITDYFDARLIPYESKKLNYGDYSMMLPKCEEYGIAKDVYFTDNIVIERKNSLDELSNNLTKDRDRFVRELERAKGAKFILLIESATYADIVYHKYTSEFKPQSFIATLASCQARYGIEVVFIDRKCSGNYVVNLFKYYLREWFKNGQLYKIV